MLEWGDIRIFLAVAREGSTLKASRCLNLNQSTVSRRIEAVEHALGVSLFRRDTRGSALTTEGKAILESAVGVETAVGRFQILANQAARAGTERIRISAAPMVINHWAAPVVAAFRSEFPGVTFDLDVSEATASLERGEADLAFRPTDRVQGDNLIARRLGSIPWGVYCADSYAERLGVPRSMPELEGHDLIFYAPQFVEKVELLRRFRESMPDCRIVSTMNSVTAMAGALRSGTGLGPVPLIDGDTTPGLTFCFHPPEMTHPLWLVAGPDSYRRPEVKAFFRLAGEMTPRGRWLYP